MKSHLTDTKQTLKRGKWGNPCGITTYPISSLQFYQGFYGSNTNRCLETRGVEPLTSTLPALRSTSWATPPNLNSEDWAINISQSLFPAHKQNDFELTAEDWKVWLDKAMKNGVPKGSRTPVAAVKGRSPRPLDDGDYKPAMLWLIAFFVNIYSQ